MYYQSAACDSGCSAASGWQIVTVATTTQIDLSRFDYSRHYFALDHLGRPRFVYRDNDGVANHRGNFLPTATATASTRLAGPTIGNRAMTI